ncbi:Lsr2 family DNA-binding protein [Nocardioides pocheonensis]|uniref:Lsr2 DNA-binding domain-containing protein n=1 Tax=Nocardioides pocheonensis TaxID=661485 RepID=A0A3N0GLS7_9ACTN|nr:histone-like nucleoid-structuring protein Lsr2 [Nocardioides pocheonensis]RNM13156.1 hypothetical protein EFL26_17205 [Nocardioides pocheonensis]
MKVTIDSSESLESAIRVLSAMYDVTLTVATETPTPAPESAPTKKASSARNAKRSGSVKAAPVAVTAKRPARASRTTAANVSASELRSWARANGYDVSNHGRLPASLATAYREAHKKN